MSAGSAAGQTFQYIEPGVAACPAGPAQGASPARPATRGMAVAGSVKVACGLDQGSYTVTLNSTDPGASFKPKTFLVNFGKLAGSGAFAVRFATAGVHRVTASITSNMGSPAAQGQFVSADNEFKVADP